MTNTNLAFALDLGQGALPSHSHLGQSAPHEALAQLETVLNVLAGGLRLPCPGLARTANLHLRVTFGPSYGRGPSLICYMRFWSSRYFAGPIRSAYMEVLNHAHVRYGV